jgi:HEAT repeat protein
VSDRHALPEQYEVLLARLSAPGWRERKQAAATLREWVADDRRRPEIMAPLAERLLDGLLSSDAIDGRAACHEVLVAIGNACADAIVRRLDTPGPSRRLLVDLLGETGDPSHVDRLRGIAGDSEADVNLRAAAGTALGRLGGPVAVEALLPLLREDAELLVVHALDALRNCEARVPVTAIEPLVARRFTRKAAASVLGRAGDPAALPVLIPLLDDPMAGVRAVAASALLTLDEDLRELGKAGLVRAALARIGPRTREHVRALIDHRDHAVRAAAVRLAGMAADPDALAAVVEVMDDPLIHEQALAMVTAMGQTAATALAEVAVRSGGAQREHVLRMIGALPRGLVDEGLLALLTQGLQDASEDAAVAAAEALERIGDRTCLGALYRAMATEGRLGEAAADAMANILERDDRDAHDDLKLIAGKTWPEEGELARNLCRVVGQIGSNRYAPHLVSMLGSTDVGVRVAAASAIGRIHGDHEGVAALSFALADEEPQVRAAACRSLGQLHAPQAVQSLITATADDSPLVRAAAVQALVALDNPVALARLRAIIHEDPVPTVVVQAIAGLGTSGLVQDLTMLMSLCTSEDWEVVKAAARALTRFRAHRATAALLGLLGHERWDVRWAAAEVLAERGDATALAPLRRALEDEADRLVRQVIEEAIDRLEGG